MQTSSPDVDIEPWLARMEAALANGVAHLTLEMGGYRESTDARLWQGSVLVDWERDEAAGGCLLRPALARRLIALGARAIAQPAAGDGQAATLTIEGPGRVVAGLSASHAVMLARLPREAEPVVRVVLRFGANEGAYLGGTEAYVVGPRAGVARRAGGGGRQRNAVLLLLTATVKPGPAVGAAP